MALNFIKNLLGYYTSISISSISSSSSIPIISESNNDSYYTDISSLPNHDKKPYEINFWFFLFFYYGFYNAIALLMITKIFDLYSLNWWPKKLGGVFAY